MELNEKLRIKLNQLELKNIQNQRLLNNNAMLEKQVEQLQQKVMEQERNMQQLRDNTHYTLADYFDSDSEEKGGNAQFRSATNQKIGIVRIEQRAIRQLWTDFGQRVI